ncbi:MAG: hypothetical protein R2726_02940 [Acidimicrobiales bacterium]
MALPTVARRARAPRARWAGVGGIRLGRAAFVVAVVLLGLVACGSDAVPLSSWRTKADDICAQVQKEADQVRPVLFTPTLADTMRKSSELSKKEASQLRDLEKPDEKRAEVREYLGSLDERVRLLDLQASLLSGSDPGGTPPSFDDLATVTAQAASQAQGLGLRKCRAGVDMSVGGSSSSTTSVAPGDPSTTLEPLSPNPNDPRGFETQDG